ncbi:MAG: hypothetical protein AABW54_04840, partial [Candidatus Micrarchaeota archaeon]
RHAEDGNSSKAVESLSRAFDFERQSSALREAHMLENLAPGKIGARLNAFERQARPVVTAAVSLGRVHQGVAEALRRQGHAVAVFTPCTPNIGCLGEEASTPGAAPDRQFVSQALLENFVAGALASRVDKLTGSSSERVLFYRMATERFNERDVRQVVAVIGGARRDADEIKRVVLAALENKGITPPSSRNKLLAALKEHWPGLKFN